MSGVRGTGGCGGGISHPLLTACGVPHAFGDRGTREPSRVVRPRQVHGTDVALLRGGAPVPPTADAIVSESTTVPVGVVTADCVPVLACSEDGRVVAAIHAGWRGLAAGILSEGIHVLRERAAPGVDLIAVIGPHIGACCYEVDEPVLNPLRARFGAELDAAARPAPGRPGHALLDLGRLATVALRGEAIGYERIGRLSDACTCCDPERFHSFRRDGQRAGRLLHRVVARPA